MQIDITGHQLDVTTSMKDYFNSKFARIKRHFDQVINVHAILSVEKIHHKAEATIKAKGVTMHAHADSENMYASIDELTDKLDSQVRKHKEKITDHHQNGGALKKQLLDG